MHQFLAALKSVAARTAALAVITFFGFVPWLLVRQAAITWVGLHASWLAKACLIATVLMIVLGTIVSWIIIFRVVLNDPDGEAPTQPKELLLFLRDSLDGSWEGALIAATITYLVGVCGTVAYLSVLGFIHLL